MGAAAQTSSIRGRQLRHAEHQPLRAVPTEVDLHAGILARTFERQHHAFAELVVEDTLAHVQTALGLGLRHAGRQRRGEVLEVILALAAAICLAAITTPAATGTPIATCTP